MTNLQQVIKCCTLDSFANQCVDMHLNIQEETDCYLAFKGVEYMGSWNKEKNRGFLCKESMLKGH